MLRDIKIGEHTLGENHPPFILAEMSGNHNQSLERALEIVDAAAAAGAHGIKLQTYTADTMTINSNRDDFKISDETSLWFGKNLYELYEEAHTPWNWHEAIFKRAEEKGLLAASTPFDESAVDFLESLNAPFYKVASFENTDLPLIERIAKTKKPMVVSCGMTSFEEIEEIVHTARSAGCKDLILLKCTSTYPASPENTNLRSIQDMREKFKCHIGLSDHTRGIGVALASIAMGSVFIEKHFTLSREDGGVDSAFSIEPSELKALVEEGQRAFLGLGSVQYGASKAEKKSLQFRRSLYFTEDLKAGDLITENNLRKIRPGFGLAPKHYRELLGKKVKQDVERGTAAAWNLIEA